VPAQQRRHVDDAESSSRMHLRNPLRRDESHRIENTPTSWRATPRASIVARRALAITMIITLKLIERADRWEQW